MDFPDLIANLRVDLDVDARNRKDVRGAEGGASSGLAHSNDDEQLNRLESILMIHEEARARQCEESCSEKHTSLKHNDRIDLRALRQCVKDIVLNTDNYKMERTRKRKASDRLAAHRGVVWRVLLGVIPSPSSLWKKELEKKRIQYRGFLKDFNFSDPTNRKRNSATKSSGSAVSALDVSLRKEKSTDGEIVLGISPSPVAIDHPLCDDANSEWKSYFKDYDLMRQIESDVDRTHPDLSFFSEDESSEDTSSTSSPKAAMRQMLFIYAKLNPGYKYVQGMNELLAPIIYCYWECGFSNTHTQNSNLKKLNELYGLQEYAEPDAFLSLLELLSEFRDFYCKQLDNSSVGIKAALTSLGVALAKYDPRLHHYLEHEICVTAQFYAFRWITLLFTQEFVFNEILILWDYLLADDRGRIECIIDMACAMLLLIRNEILGGDFASNMKLLQNYPTGSISIRMIMILTERLKGVSNLPDVRAKGVANIVNSMVMEVKNLG